MNDPAKQFALQLAATVAVLSLAWPLVGFSGAALDWRLVASAIGGVAFLLAWATRQPIWWRAIHALFVPLAWAVAQADLDPGWFLLGFILLLLVYRGAISGKVPLFLTPEETISALKGLTRDARANRFVDLGGGIGSVVAPLADALPGVNFSAVENAPLTWFFGRIRTAGRRNCRWLWGDFWTHDLGDYDLVYAFLSPQPMPELWRKASAEMRQGSWFVSNSFPVPDVVPTRVVDADGTFPLYCYRMS